MNQYFENNEKLASELRKIKYQINDIDFVFNSDLGVFSKNHIDYGSKVLVETIINNNKNYKSILDLGCGYGYIGIVLGKIFNAQVEMVDINQRSIHLCKKNIKENKVGADVYISSAYDEVNNKFDLIVTNPPIRAGKNIVLEFLMGAKDYLKKDGELWFVIRKDQGAKSIEKQISELYKVDLVKKSKGFYIFSAKMIDN
ncbi:MAG: class I SAM-dependent methyltransferase [Mollicutes bacterium]|nr:class I SAM-dependent methyltransferase [Mollicutes bacterium]